MTAVKFVKGPTGGIRYIVTTSRDRSVKIWGVSGLGSAQAQVLLEQTLAMGQGRPTSPKYNTSTHHVKSVWGLDVKWPYLVTASADNTLKAWKFKGEEEEDALRVTSPKEPKFKHVRDQAKKSKKAGNQVRSTQYRLGSVRLVFILEITNDLRFVQFKVFPPATLVMRVLCLKMLSFYGWRN